jgi:2-keto-4-pentenoate hydratase/2-oxohepta-3-ene-1,7-dioic acid hydratase in catechol pathway
LLSGPAVVTVDELGNPHNLGIRCSVNGVMKQNSNTNQLVFGTEKILAWCSQFFELLPGDLILTGTPPGVGVFMKPPEFLKVGYCFLLQFERYIKIFKLIIKNNF